MAPPSRLLHPSRYSPPQTISLLRQRHPQVLKQDYYDRREQQMHIIQRADLNQYRHPQDASPPVLLPPPLQREKAEGQGRPTQRKLWKGQAGQGGRTRLKT